MHTHGFIPGQQLAAQLTSAFSCAPGAGDRPWLRRERVPRPARFSETLHSRSMIKQRPGRCR